MRWAVKARDGWHFSNPNRPHREDTSNVGILCGGYVVLPGGCEMMDLVDCDECQRVADDIDHRKKD